MSLRQIGRLQIATKLNQSAFSYLLLDFDDWLSTLKDLQDSPSCRHGWIYGPIHHHEISARTPAADSSYPLIRKPPCSSRSKAIQRAPGIYFTIGDYFGIFL